MLALFLSLLITTDEYRYHNANPLQKFFYHLEVLDISEIHNYCNWDKSFFKDIDILKRRFQTVKYAPRIFWLNVFPDKYSARTLYEIMGRYVQYLRTMNNLYPKRGYEQLLHEAEQRYEVYKLLDEAHLKYLNVYEKRMRLEKIYHAIGEKNFLSGCLPPISTLD